LKRLWLHIQHLRQDYLHLAWRRQERWGVREKRERRRGLTDELAEVSTDRVPGDPDVIHEQEGQREQLRREEERQEGEERVQCTVCNVKASEGIGGRERERERGERVTS
jgi:hypothetical protein